MRMRSETAWAWWILMLIGVLLLGPVRGDESRVSIEVTVSDLAP